jgi:hypothetical protein
MELELKEFGLTLAVGLALLALCRNSLQLTYPTLARRLFRWFTVEQKAMAVLVFTVPVLAVGIVCEDISKEALAENATAVAFSPQLRQILQSEPCSHRDALLVDPASPEAAAAPDVPSATDNIVTDCEFDSKQLLLLTYSRLGSKVSKTLQELEFHTGETTREREISASLGGCVAPSKCLGKKSRQLAQELYYIAKNTAYTNTIYAKDMDQYRLRYDFDRSMVFVFLVSIYLLSILYVFRSLSAMWRDVNSWKSTISVALLIVGAVALLNVLIPADTYGRICQSAEIDCRTIVVHISSRSATNIQNWLLPASALFITLYRTRRMWKRLYVNLRVANDSTFAPEPLIQYPREIEAIRVMRILVVLTVVILPVRFAYLADMVYYTDRVFGYYQVMRDGKLQCSNSKCELVAKTGAGDGHSE